MNYYRLLAVDIDGSMEDHGIRAAYYFGSTLPRILGNPIRDGKLHLSVHGLSEHAQLYITSYQGTTLLQQTITQEATLNLPAGLYLLKIVDGPLAELHKLYFQYFFTLQ